MSAAPGAIPGRFADRYQVERVLGEGATAIVYLAKDSVGRPVAIKMLRPELAGAKAGSRFVQEIRRTSTLTHPRIVPVLDSGDHQGQLYVVLPFMEGGTLRDRLRREKQLPLEDALRIARPIAEALDHAHAHGLIHRDVKPENILFTQGEAHLGDFGIARALEHVYGEVSTSANIVRGTPAYMSPEQAAGPGNYDGRSDIFSLACVFYEMLSGMPAYMGPTPESIIAQRFAHPPRELRVYRPTAPLALETVINKAMAIQPADRYRSAAEFVDALEHAATAVEPMPPLRRTRWQVPRSLALVGAAILLILGAVVARVALRTPLQQNDWILVADFDGPAEDLRFANDVRDLATQALKQSRFLQVFDRRQLNEVMRRASIPETTHVTIERARELASRSSVRAVLSGSVRRMTPSTLELVLHVVAADDGSSLAADVRTATEATLADSMHVLVRAIRRRLGERRGAITSTRPLRDVATPSFEAFRKYSAALDAIAFRNDHAASTRLLQEALRLDTAFAAAWAVMGANYLSARQLDSARYAYNKALAFPSRLSPAEVYRLKGDAAYAFDHDLKATLAWYDLYLAEAPNSRSGRTNRAVYRSALGQWSEAVRDLRDAVPLNAFGAALIQPTLFNLAAALVVVGEIREARAVRDSLTGAPSLYIDLILAQAEGRWPDAEHIAVTGLSDSRVTGFYRIHALTSAASAMAAQGAVVSADSVLRVAVGASAGSAARWYDRARLLLALASGDTAGKVMTVSLRSDTSAAADMLHGLWESALGDTLKARAVLGRHLRASPRESAVFGSAPVLIDAWIAARRGDWRRVVDQLGAAAWSGEMDPTIFDRPDSYQMRWLVARAYEELNRPDSAIAFHAVILRPTIVPPGHYPLRGFIYPFVLAKRARLQLMNRDVARARDDIDALTRSFIKPDSAARRTLRDAQALLTSASKPR